MTETHFEKLEKFAETIAAHQLDRLVKDKLDCAGNRARATAKLVPGRKYTKVNVGDSGRYMVDNETGEIFGIKGYGQIHRGHRYGTLDTISQFYWGHYTARPIDETTPYRAIASESGVVVTPECPACGGGHAHTPANCSAALREGKV